MIAFARQQGLRVTATYASRTVLDVAGTADVIEKAFGVRMLQYQSPAGRQFRGPDAEPVLPASIAGRVAGIVGLDNAIEPKSNLIMSGAVQAEARVASGSPNRIGTGPGNGMSPNDIKNAYNLSAISQTGTGQTIALVELDGYNASDITTYENYFGLTNVTLQNVLLDGVSGTPTAATPQIPYPRGPGEVTLDIELAIALAPGMTRLLVYEGTSFTDIFQRIADDNIAQQVSSSWYDGVDSSPSSSTLNAENSAFQQMASQGQSLFAATGDFGDQVCLGRDSAGNCNNLQFGVQDPSAQPYCTAVGGTTLSTNGSGGTYASETAWSGSTGGISIIWLIPSYQSAVVSPGSGGSPISRNVPDVSLNSDPNSGYAIYFYGSWFGGFGGTSAAAPLWAAYTALVNQHRGSLGFGRLGFLNPTIYYLAHTDQHTSYFHDITTGNNGTYPAVTGYDNVTGWGSFNGGNLFYALTFAANAVWVDHNNAGFQFGTPQYPFKTIGQAILFASPGNPTLTYIRGGTYPEHVTINKPMLPIPNGGGPVTIGN